MKLIFSGHAQKRMGQRGITSLEVEFILQHSSYIKKSFEGRKEAAGQLKGKNIKVVFIEVENYIKVITII